MESCLSYNQRLSLQNIGIATIHLGQSVRCARHILLHSLSSYSITKGVSYNVECAMYLLTKDRNNLFQWPPSTTALNEYLGWWCYTAKLNFTSSRVLSGPVLSKLTCISVSHAPQSERDPLLFYVTTAPNWWNIVVPVRSLLQIWLNRKYIIYNWTD